ncbi:MAG TPA: ATP synthase F0 subunit B [Kofleriaceae bacterium]
MNPDSGPETPRPTASFDPEWSGSFPPRENDDPDDICDVDFPVVLRGYSREAVDAYVGYVNRVVYELRMNRSPRSAVRHALDRVGDQVGGLLREARQTADEMLAAARAEADGIAEQAREEAFTTTLRAKTEADAIRSQAQDDADRLRGEGRQELDRLRARANQELGEHRARIDAIHRERAVALEAAQALATRLQSLAGDGDPAQAPPPETVPADADAGPPTIELTEAIQKERARRARRTARTRRR